MGRTSKRALNAVESVERLHYVIKATSDIVWEWNIKEGILYRGYGFKELIGDDGMFDVDSLEEFVERVHPTDKKRLLKEIDTCLKNKNCSKWTGTYRYRISSGNYVYMLDRACIIRNDKDEATRLIGALQNINDLKLSEVRAVEFQEVLSELSTDQSLFEEKLSIALPEVLKKAAETLQVERANAWLLEADTMRCVASYDGGAINETADYVFSKDQIPSYIEELHGARTISFPDVLKDGQFKALTDTYLKPNNISSLLDTKTEIGDTKVVVCHESVGSKRKWKHNEISFAGTITDFVARLIENHQQKVRKRKLQQSLQEKEVLLKEIHHRVKNNLALISGMVQLQAFDEENEAIYQNLMDWVNRIGSMANIHEQLYQTERFSKVDFATNLKKLVAQIIKTLNSKKIDTQYNLNSVALNINKAIPCSLIVNEVITNIIKYAFNGQENGKIAISLREENKRVHLSIKDNGIGLPKSFCTDGKPKTLGMELIKTLAKQLSAVYDYQSDGDGTMFSLRFKK